MNYLKEQLVITGILILTLIFLVGLFTVAASAQTNVKVLRAELAMAFDKAEGKIVAFRNALFFVDDDKPEYSFVIEKENIADWQTDDEVLTIQTRKPLKDRSGERTRFVFRLKNGEAKDLVKEINADSGNRNFDDNKQIPAKSPVAPMIYEAVHKHRFFGSCTGRLIFGDDRISFESSDDRDHSRQWLYKDIKKMKRNSPYKLEVKPFTGDGYELEILGQGIDITDFKMFEDHMAAIKAARQ